MDSKEQHSASENDAHRPLKRARHSPPPTSTQESPNRNGNGSSNGYSLPLLSLSILGVEPLDEFIREVADFVHHMITTRPEGAGQVEVEAKIGVLRDKLSGQRVQLPVLVETSECYLCLWRAILTVKAPSFSPLFSNLVRVAKFLYRTQLILALSRICLP